MSEAKPHFAYPFKFEDHENAKCVLCKEPIILYTQPNGRKIWRHKAEVNDD